MEPKIVTKVPLTRDTDSVTIFWLLVSHYVALQEFLASLENIILSYNVQRQDEEDMQGKIARKIWDRDYVVDKSRNLAAKAVLSRYWHD